MTRIRRFIRLSASDRVLLVFSVFLIWTIRFGLTAFSLRRMKNVLSRLRGFPVRSSNGRNGFDQDRVAWSVGAAGQSVPGAGNCLAQALAAAVLLGWWHYPGRIWIGVARGGQGELTAHAWVESRDSIISGGADVSDYTRLLVLKGEVR